MLPAGAGLVVGAHRVLARAVVPDIGAPAAVHDSVRHRGPVYPQVSYRLGRDVWNMGNVSANANATVHSGSNLAYCTTYDAWGNDHDYEMMIWTQWHGAVGPIGTYVTDVNLGSRNWAFYQGSNGSNAVYRFLARSHSTNSWVDITTHAQWLVANGRMSRVSNDEIAFGFEITSSTGGHNFNRNSYSLWT